MDLDKVFSLIDKAEKSSFNTIKIQIGDIKLSLDRSQSTPAEVTDQPEKPAPKPTVVSKNEEMKKEDVVFAPISGVFYIAKEPGAEPFVKPGSKVKKGDTLCIIEAMKTMNEISAPKDGVIERILKNDSDTVAAKDALFTYAEE